MELNAPELVAGLAPSRMIAHVLVPTRQHALESATALTLMILITSAENVIAVATATRMAINENSKTVV